MKKILLFALLSLCSNASSTDVDEFVRLETQNRETALKKYKPLFDDSEKLFDGLLDVEITKLEKENDPILTKPDWTLVVCDRVFKRYEKSLSGIMKIEEALPLPQTPTPPNPSYPANKAWTGAKGSFLIDGQRYEGAIHELRDGNILITSDVNAGNPHWVPMSKLSSETRVWLGIGNAADIALVAEKNAIQAEERARYEASAARDAASQAAIIEQVRLDAIRADAKAKADEEMALKRVMLMNQEIESERLMRLKEREVSEMSRAASALERLSRK